MFSHSALVRIADEVCLQMHLIDRGFAMALAERADAGQVLEIRRKQLTGVAGVAAERLARLFDLPRTPEGAVRLLALHPLLNPAAYVRADVDAMRIVVRPGPADEDGSWISLCGPEWTGAARDHARTRRPPRRRGDRAARRVGGRGGVRPRAGAGRGRGRGDAVQHRDDVRVRTTESLPIFVL